MTVAAVFNYFTNVVTVGSRSFVFNHRSSVRLPYNRNSSAFLPLLFQILRRSNIEKRDSERWMEQRDARFIKIYKLTVLSNLNAFRNEGKRT